MPSERFFRLPKEKADIIRKAAIQEFQRVSPEEASINKIIQTAEISRGSFYTYFDDKMDLIKWVMGDFIENFRRFYINELEENGGDLWDVFDRVLYHTIHWVDEQGLVEIVGNMMRSNFFTEQMARLQEEDCRREAVNRDYTSKIYNRVDPKFCSISREEFSDLMRMHTAALIVSLKLYFAKEKEMSVIERSYHHCMKLLRYGACPRTEQVEK